MLLSRLTRLELKILDVLWGCGVCSLREIQQAFPQKGRPAYSTIQTTVYRMEAKGKVRRVKKISNAHMFEAIVTREVAQTGVIDELLSFFGGQSQLVMAHFIKNGKLTLKDVKEAEKALREIEGKDKKR
jgi:BlaI family penicillinase repressor